jgi:hypothetical protein
LVELFNFNHFNSHVISPSMFANMLSGRLQGRGLHREVVEGSRPQDKVF